MDKTGFNWILIPGISLAILVLAVLTILILNYFNILSLSKIYPQLGFLPHQTYQQQKTTVISTPAPTPTPALGIKLSCPVPAELCQKGKILGDDNSTGIGFNLPPGTPILAVFAGQTSSEPKIADRNPKQPYLYLRDPEGKEVFYSFYGTLSAKPGTTVEAGAELGKIGPGTFPAGVSLDDLNFFLTLKKEGQYQKIDIELLRKL